MPRGTAHKWIRSALAVIVTAAVIVPVAAYAVRHAHEMSEQRTCAGNLKLLGQACEMYQADWHDVLVPYGAPFTFGHDGTWPNLLLPYIRRMPQYATADLGDAAGAFLCPVDSRLEESIVHSISYGINPRCGGWMPKGKQVVVPLKRVKYPAKTIRSAEARWLIQGGTLFAARPSELDASDPMCHMFATRHNGKGNVLWIDGHVSAMTREQYNMRDKGPDDGNIWLRLEGPKPPLP